jgi:hypothetical protein
MHRCVAAICHRHEYGRVIPLFDGLDTGARGVGTKIGQRLFALNIGGIRPDRDDVLRPEIARLPKHYRYEPPAVELALPELIASIKALHCLHYQCDEQPNERNPLLAPAVGLCDHANGGI